MFDISKGEELWQAANTGNLEMVRKLASDPSVDVNFVGPENSDSPLHTACRMRHLEVFRELMAHPRVQVTRENVFGGTATTISCCVGVTAMVVDLLADSRIDPVKPTTAGATPIFFACQEGHVDIVRLLLLDPRIDPSKITGDLSPFRVACERGHSEVVRLLLLDPRIDVNRPDASNCTPLWQASQEGHLDIVRQLLASGREIDTKIRSEFNDTTAAEQGRAMGNGDRNWNDTEDEYQRSLKFGPLCADVIDEYDRNPRELQVRLRRLPGVRGHFIGLTFALVVFFSDGFLRLRRRTRASPHRVVSFFEICLKLPLELQMLVCNRLFGSGRDVVRSADSEPGFRWLVRPLTWSHHS